MTLLKFIISYLTCYGLSNALRVRWSVDRKERSVYYFHIKSKWGNRILSSKNKTEVKENNQFSLEKIIKIALFWFLRIESWCIGKDKGWQVWVQNDKNVPPWVTVTGCWDINSFPKEVIKYPIFPIGISQYPPKLVNKGLLSKNYSKLKQEGW